MSHGTDSVRAHEYSHRTATEWESRQFLQVLPTFSLSLNRPKRPRVFEAYTAEEAAEEAAAAAQCHLMHVVEQNNCCGINGSSLVHQ